ncbi:MAG: hypothetical protein JSV43_04205, partial [Methanobacteriota archaeon]
MAKRRKVEIEEGMTDCHYCKKTVPESAWRCPHCRRWFREGKIGILGMIAILALVIALVLYLVKPTFLFGGDDDTTVKEYNVDLSLDTGPQIHKAEQGGYTEYAIRVTNLANAADTIELSSPGNPNLVLTYDDSISMTSGDQAVTVIRAEVPSVTPLGSYDFRITATSKSNRAVKDIVDLTVDVVTLSDRYVVSTDKVQVHYILWLSDGEFRESSYARGDTLLVSVDPANQDGTYIGVIPGFS